MNCMHSGQYPYRANKIHAYTDYMSYGYSLIFWQQGLCTWGISSCWPSSNYLYHCHCQLLCQTTFEVIRMRLGNGWVSNIRSRIDYRIHMWHQPLHHTFVRQWTCNLYLGTIWPSMISLRMISCSIIYTSHIEQHQILSWKFDLAQGFCIYCLGIQWRRLQVHLLVSLYSIPESIQSRACVHSRSSWWLHLGYTRRNSKDK